MLTIEPVEAWAVYDNGIRVSTKIFEDYDDAEQEKKEIEEEMNIQKELEWEATQRC